MGSKQYYTMKTTGIITISMEVQWKTQMKDNSRK